ncbi:MAG: hypothetical protein COA52_01010 [Hyphomicrobiales bacterium]|nr:MAG: hypothetical protein COA52_01010 [Hyphomicrobiales bacterium]
MAKMKYTSKGEIGTDTKLKNSLRRDYIASGNRVLNQRKAWAVGKNVMLTIENPNPNEKNKKYIKVKATDVWGSHKPKRKANEKQ